MAKRKECDKIGTAPYEGIKPFVFRYGANEATRKLDCYFHQILQVWSVQSTKKHAPHRSTTALVHRSILVNHCRPILAHHRRPKTLISRRPTSSIRHQSILKSGHRSILSRETWGNFNQSSQHQNPYSNNYINNRGYGSSYYQKPPPPTQESKIEEMLDRVLEGQQRMTVDFNGKIDSRESTASCNAETAIDRQPPAPIDRRGPITYQVQMPKIDVVRLNALSAKPKPSENPPEAVKTPSEDETDSMEVDRVPTGRTLRRRKEKVAKHLKRGANEKEKETSHCGAEYETEYSASIETHTVTSIDSAQQKSTDGAEEESVDRSPTDWENDCHNPILAVNDAPPETRKDLHKWKQIHFLQNPVEKELASAESVKQTDERQSTSRYRSRSTDPRRNRSIKIYWEEKDEYEIYRDDQGCARDVDGHIINVSKEDIRKLMERASRDEHSYICLPEHASSFTQTKLVPEIYTKDEINVMFYGICGEQEKNKGDFQMNLDGVYYPLNDSIRLLTTCMEEMRQDIARIQRATDVSWSTSIDRHRPASIDDRLPASVDENPPHSHTMKSQPDFHTREEIDQLVEGIYRALETTEERLDRICDDIYFPMDLSINALTSNIEAIQGELVEIRSYIARRPEASASIDRRNNKSTDTHKQTSVDNATNRGRLVQKVTSDMFDTHNHGEEISTDTYATVMRHQFNLESLGDILQKIEDATTIMKDKRRRREVAMRDFTDSTKDTKVDQPVNYVTLAEIV
ncbi:hypothetical protein DY000_02048235 [Brassica cretica]|uniref:DUF287 domain-containing protein n=1 Tax=Brassica cretica TaxID=69181 RepID=A0ABQ7F4I0_BRACR|nr:hypothetical protein DY000_02048235 [Brassica cretica]